MAEAAVGFLGTAAGLVSLGIQVYGGLKKYLDDFHSRDDRIRKTLDYLEQLKNSLDIINIAVPALPPQQHVSKDIVTYSLKSCKDELQSLQDRLHKYETVTRTDVKEKIRDMKMKLRFPFQVSELSDLEYRLERIIRTLMVAINGLGLNTLADVRAAMLDTNTSSQTTKAILATLEAKANTLQSSHDGSMSRLVDIESILISMIDVPMSEVSGRLSNIEDVTSSTQVELISRFDAQSQILTDIKGLLQSQQLQSCQSNAGLYTRRLTEMMVSKPALLKEMHDTFSPPQGNTQLVSLSGTQLDSRGAPAMSSRRWSIPEMSCNCRPRRKKTRNLFRWSQFWLSNETTTHIKHLPGCPWTNPIAQEYQRDFGIVFTGLRRFMSTAVSISLSIKHDVDGYSISMAPRYFTMIDRSRSPAFVMVDFIWWRIILSESIPKNQLHDDDIKSLFDYAISRLRIMYQTGVATPTEVDCNGKTILQYIAELNYNPARDFHLSGTNYLKTAIMNMGVPYESNVGNSSSSHFVRLIIPPINVADILAEYWETVVLHSLRNLSDFNYSTYDSIYYCFLRKQILESEEVTEALGLDSPFSQAIRRRDKNGLQRALQSLQGSRMNGRDVRDQQWPHIALICWPPGLELILDNCPGLDHGNSRNALLASLLHIAARHCRTTVCLAHSNTERCSDECSCTAVIDILLKRNCPLRSSIARIILRYGSLKQVDTILRYIKDGRERLRDLSYRYLSDEEQMRFGICDSSIPDWRAAEIVAALERKGISPYRCLKLEPYDYRLCHPDSGLDCGSIFHRIVSAEHAELAFNLGFRDVDMPFGGETPLCRTCRGRFYYPRNRLSYACWLIDHGADYTLRVVDKYNPSRRTVAHYLSDTLVCYLTWDRHRPYPTYDREVRQLYNLLSNLQIEDDCVCGCSAPSQGCYPLTILLNSLQKYAGNADMISILESICSGIQSEMLFESVIRVLTFHRLGIRHTCCNKAKNQNHTTYFGDELDCIRDEDEALLKRLEVLVTEFVNKFSRGGCTLSEFIQGTWTTRMEQIDEEERSRILTQEEKDSLRSIGVELVDESSGDTCISKKTDSATPESREARYQNKVKRLYWKIDEISNGRIPKRLLDE
ncbi:hypothetical protein F4809DRAFT_634069 [Biscogniauxia mediterranea]|nr:hypothetical protein F4809DRAFT_634069 [Biscogniauxia mediterranea]